MVHLARKYDGQSVIRADDIAESEAIPPSFLAQILHELKRTGLVTSRRGKTGGWRLARSPAEISLLAIVEALEPEALGQLPAASGESGSAVSKLWEEVRESSRRILAETSLESIATITEPMFYI
ncbi:MAG: Rrf2 family protein [Akkermansiaceae bacterium]|jgi:Rrf2 family cysteine metabolism transcriptional repressor